MPKIYIHFGPHLFCSILWFPLYACFSGREQLITRFNLWPLLPAILGASIKGLRRCTPKMSHRGGNSMSKIPEKCGSCAQVTCIPPHRPGFCEQISRRALHLWLSNRNCRDFKSFRAFAKYDVRIEVIAHPVNKTTSKLNLRFGAEFGDAAVQMGCAAHYFAHFSKISFQPPNHAQTVQVFILW